MYSYTICVYRYTCILCILYIHTFTSGGEGRWIDTQVQRQNIGDRSSLKRLFGTYMCRLSCSDMNSYEVYSCERNLFCLPVQGNGPLATTMGQDSTPQHSAVQFLINPNPVETRRHHLSSGVVTVPLIVWRAKYQSLWFGDVLPVSCLVGSIEVLFPTCWWIQSIPRNWPFVCSQLLVYFWYFQSLGISSQSLHSKIFQASNTKGA